MLDHVKLAHALRAISKSSYEIDNDSVCALGKVWREIQANEERMRLFCDDNVMRHRTPQAEGPFTTLYPIAPNMHEYTVCAIDGSQIYPDRHRLMPWALINIGAVTLTYTTEISAASFDTFPHVFVASQAGQQDEGWIDCVRQQYELMYGYNHMSTIQAQPTVLLFDGSLLFWHLQSKDPYTKEFFFDVYQQTLDRLHEQNVLCAWYISVPSSKELVQAISKAGKELFSYDFDERIERITDAYLLNMIMPQPCTRTTVFKSNVAIAQQYVAALHPYFLYAQFGCDLVRIEIPAWVVRMTGAVDTIVSIIGNQVQKGNGYPISIAEAHEQAVVKTNDREQFYTLIRQFCFTDSAAPHVSQKLFKKQKMAL